MNDETGSTLGATAAQLVDREQLRAEIRTKYLAVAEQPDGEYHFHTGRALAALCGYDDAAVGVLPDHAVEAFAGVANPFALRSLEPGERVVDIGSGAGFDCILAANAVGPDGHVVGVDMTVEMRDRAAKSTSDLGLDNLEFREGFAEELPIEDGWADVVISNGVFNLCPDKLAVFVEVWRTLKAGGVLQFADIANGRSVPEEAMRDIDLWTG